MGRKSKQKGNRYESRVVKLLSEFTKVNFRRVPASGGFNKCGGAKVAEHVFSGDVICDRADFLYSVEAKNAEALSLLATLKSPDTCVFTKFWYQCTQDAISTNRRPIMFFKPNISDDWVAILKEDIEDLGLCLAPKLYMNIYGDREVSISILTIDQQSKFKKKKKITVQAKLPDPVLFDWNTLIKHANPACLFKDRMFLTDKIADEIKKEIDQKLPAAS